MGVLHNPDRVAIAQTNKNELRKLLEIIPRRYLDTIDEATNAEEMLHLELLEETFWAVLDMVPVEERERLAKYFVELIKTGKEQEISVYGDLFFGGHEMKYLSEDERQIVIEHTLPRIESINPEKARLLVGFMQYLNNKQLTHFFDTMIDSAILSRHKRLIVTVSGYIRKEFMNLPSNNSAKVAEQFANVLDDNEFFLHNKFVQEIAEVMGLLPPTLLPPTKDKNEDDDIPF